jgi:cobalt-zinc-cadmium efflux system membrane fusion protein
LPGVNNMTTSLRSYFALTIISTSLLGIVGCSDKVADTPASAAPVRDPLQIQISGELANLIKSGTLSEGEYSDMIRLAGRLEVNANQTSRIGSPMTGRLTRIVANLGQHVKAGEVMAEVSSQELTAAQLAFLKAHAAEQVASRAVERAQLLVQADVIGMAELQRRQKEHEVASAEKRAATDQLRVLGLGQKSVQQLAENGRIDSVAPVTASISGVVIERQIAQGQVVQPSDALFVVSDLSNLWAIAEVPEQEAAQVKLGQSVEIEIPALNHKVIMGRLVFISDVVNPETRTVRVRAVLDNAERQLKPAMLTSMLIEGKPQQRTLIPQSAVVRENDADHVFLEVAPQTYRLTRVSLGPEHKGVRPLLAPLPNQANPNTPPKIVLDGAFHLNNQRIKQNLG